MTESPEYEVVTAPQGSQSIHHDNQKSRRMTGAARPHWGQRETMVEYTNRLYQYQLESLENDAIITIELYLTLRI